MKLTSNELSFYSLAATLLFVLTLIGFPLVTTIFLPSEKLGVEDVAISRGVTVPYRILMLLLCIYLIIFKPKNYSSKPCNTREFIIFFVFWIMYLIRIIFDMYIRTDSVKGLFTDTIEYYVPLITIPTLFAIYNCSGHIDYKRALKYLVILGLLFVGLLVFRSPDFLMKSDDMESRMVANAALGSIGLGQVSIAVCMLIIMYIKHNNISFWLKMICFLGIFLSVFLMLRAGSRGPLFQGIAIFVIYQSLKRKQIILSLLALLLILSVLFFLKDRLFDLISNLSPVLGNRLEATMAEGDTSGRDIYYSIAIANFLKSPFIGETFLVDGRIYAHNYFIDSLMALGILGGLLFTYIVYHLFVRIAMLFRTNSEYEWLGLLSLQCFLAGLTSGCFYTDTEFSKYLIILFTCPILLNQFTHRPILLNQFARRYRHRVK